MFLANLGIILIPKSTTKTTPPNNKYKNTDWLPGTKWYNFTASFILLNSGLICFVIKATIK